jgi:hypothetical protein
MHKRVGEHTHTHNYSLALSCVSQTAEDLFPVYKVLLLDVSKAAFEYVCLGFDRLDLIMSRLNSGPKAADMVGFATCIATNFLPYTDISQTDSQ